jgi:hypothetical protein
MDIQTAVEEITSTITPQSVAAAACGYSAAHFCSLVNRARKGERIPIKAEKIIVGYANQLRRVSE